MATSASMNPSEPITGFARARKRSMERPSTRLSSVARSQASGLSGISSSKYSFQIEESEDSRARSAPFAPKFMEENAPQILAYK